MKGPIQIFFRLTPKNWPEQKLLDPRKIFWPIKRPTQKNLDPRKKSDPRKSIFDPRNPRKNYNPHKMMTHVKNILTHVTYATHVNIWPTQPTLPRDPRDLADSEKCFWFHLKKYFFILKIFKFLSWLFAHEEKRLD